MSETLPANATLEGGETIPRRGPGRPPKNPAEIKVAADEAAAEIAETFAPPVPMATVIISIKPSEGWRCPWFNGRITKPKEQLRVPLVLAKEMEANEQAIILETD